MAADPQQDVMTVSDYLHGEEVGDVKHEYVSGHVYAMSGGTIGHDAVANNLRALIHTHVRGGLCRLCGPDVILRVSPETYYYPDAFVVCDTALDPAARVLASPCLIVEILSASTEANDRGDKFKSYQSLETCKEYLLIDGRKRGIERFHRSGRGLWVYQQYAPDDAVTLETIGFTCPFADLYEGTGL